MTTKTKLIQNLKNDTYARLQPSTIHGIGVFAIKSIPPKVNPFSLACPNRYKTIELDLNDIPDIPVSVKKLLDDFVGSKRDNKTVYDVPKSGMNGIDITFYLNHSDSPNLNIIERPGIDLLEFESNRLIETGEELSINYKDYNDK